MLLRTLTHSLDCLDQRDDRARCGAALTILTPCSAEPTCPACAASVLSEEQYEDALQALADICFDDAEVEL